jgi:hypothetical protein
LRCGLVYPINPIEYLTKTCVVFYSGNKLGICIK